MFYSNEFIEKVRRRSGILKIVSEYTSLEKRGNMWYGKCPFHNETEDSFTVDGRTFTYYCFGCGAGGNIFDFVMRIQKCSFQQAVIYLAQRLNMEIPEPTLSPRDIKSEDCLVSVNKAAARYYFSKLRNGDNAGLHYLKKRGLSCETISKFGLGFAGCFGKNLFSYLRSKGFSEEDVVQVGLAGYGEVFTKNETKSQDYYDKFWNRVIFPIVNIDGNVIGFGGRVLGNGKPKYLNSSETAVFHKGNNLYAMNLAKNSIKDYFILCEGYMDVISMHQAGFDNAIASLGTALTSQQADLMSKYKTKVLLAYDSDEPGVLATTRAIPVLNAAGITVKVISMKPYKDPDEFIKALGCASFNDRIKSACNSDRFLLGRERNGDFYEKLADLLVKTMF